MRSTTRANRPDPARGGPIFVSSWRRAGVAFLLGAAFALSGAAACSSTPSKDSNAAGPGRLVALWGLYTAKAQGFLGDLAVDDAGRYVLRPEACHETRCVETGRAADDEGANILTLEGELGAPRRTLALRVISTTSQAQPPSLGIAPKTELTGGGTPLVEGDGGPVLEAGAGTTDGSVEVLTTVQQATVDGQRIELVEGTSTSEAGAPNSTRPPWPGSIPGVLALRAPSFGEATTVHPGGHSVTVAKPGDPAFATDPQLAARYAGIASVYNSHGMPGMLVGGIPEAAVRQMLSSDQPLIVASCFSAAQLAGGSTIRRLVSAYGDAGDASRVYGCTGYAYPIDTQGLGCTGAWLDANHQSIPLVERQRLGLVQMTCRRNVFVNGRPDWSDCVRTE